MREAVNASFTEGLHDLIAFNRTNIILGFACFMINILLLSTLFVSPVLRKKTEMLTVLCIADGINCFSIALMGINRTLLYTKVINTLLIPVRTSWQCATEPWLIFRVYGDLWPSTVQMLMAVDRVVALFYPVRYNNQFLKKRRGTFFAVTFVAVTCTVLIGYVITFTRGAKKAKYWCGRKAAFGNFYGSFIYILRIFGYFCSFVLTTISYFKSKYRVKNSSSKKQLIKIRYQIFLSMFSIILVSIPNGIALFEQYVGTVAAYISKPSTYLTCINSALGIFIYLALYGKFRNEFFQMIRMLICHVRSDYRWGTRLSTINKLVATHKTIRSSARPEFLKH